MNIQLADFTDSKHQNDIKVVLNAYSLDPMGNGKSLDSAILEKVVKDMAHIPGAFSFLAYHKGKAVGLVNCFTGYSTFKAKPLVNIHDIVVLPESRGLGIGDALLKTVLAEAKKRNCCKVTLEVRNDNKAKNLYLRAGFKEGNPPMEFLTNEF